MYSSRIHCLVSSETIIAIISPHKTLNLKYKETFAKIIMQPKNRWAKVPSWKIKLIVNNIEYKVPRLLHHRNHRVSPKFLAKYKGNATSD